MKIENRKARHDYFVEDEIVAGILLKGTEIKSVRKGQVQLKDSYISIYKGEAFLKGVNISKYQYGNIFNHDERRDRKLLLHKREILRLEQKVKLKGYTLVPLEIIFVNGVAKVVVGLCKGKTNYDKRESDKIRSLDKEARKYQTGM